MMAIKETFYTKDEANKKLRVTREFDATVDKLWRAWTEPKLLDQWWAPKPWKAVTVSMDFRNGGTWNYYMQGPDDTRHYCRADYSNIMPVKSFMWLDAFCDEKGNINDEFPRMKWKTDFLPTNTRSKVEIEISFTSDADMQTIIDMGFKEGFAAAHNNLDELLERLD